MTSQMNMVDVEVLDDLNQPVPAAIIMLHDNIIIALRNAYPLWAESWLIRIDTRGGIVQIYNTAISGKMGFVIHIRSLTSHKDMHKVVKAAGELFERYGIARKKALDIKQALADLKRTPTREAIYED
ncbi:MAG: hypothetical protein V3R76_00250 [Gammaproteobacteria bacterium]